MRAGGGAGAVVLSLGDGPPARAGDGTGHVAHGRNIGQLAVATPEPVDQPSPGNG